MERLRRLSFALLCCACTALTPSREVTDMAEGERDGAPRKTEALQARRGSMVEVSLSTTETREVPDTADLFVYDDDLLRRLDTYQRTSIGNGTMKVACTSGSKILAAIVNGHTGRYSWSASNTFSYIEGLDAEFAVETPTRPTMSGICLMNNEGGTEKLPELNLTPLLSMICLRSIRCDFSGRAYEGATLDDAQVYLTNVSSICRIFQEEDFTTRGTINTRRLDASDLERLSCPSMVWSMLPSSIGKDFIETDIDMYCYPNTNAEDSFTTPYTRLVIEGKIEGETWYWPININREDICWVEACPGVERGKKYVYDVTIKRTGSKDPDMPVSLHEVSLACSVLPWKEEERNETF